MKSPDSSLRLGAEMAGYAKTKGVAGIFHSDELPNYGITQEYVDLVRAKLQLSPEDAFALCADEEKKASAAIVAAVKRANMALEGVPDEGSQTRWNQCLFSTSAWSGQNVSGN